MTTQLELTAIKRAWIDEAAAKFNSLPLPATFTNDDLHSLLPVPAHPNWFGVLLASLKAQGRVRCEGYRASARKERNGGVLRIWAKTN